jgi:acetate---CoA ligase (ADP-forming)
LNLDRLFRPRRVAVLGGKWADYVVEQCTKLGFDGDIWRVHPERENCFSSVDALPGIPDSVFLGVNRELTIDNLTRLREQGVGGAVVFASGFGEAVDGGDAAARLDAAAGDVPFIGPNCYGFANFFDRVALWPDQVVGTPVSRGVAIIGQSGTISLSLMYQRRSLPTGYVITVGNQQRLDCADLIRHVANDDRVSAIGLYVEGIGDVADFIDAVEHARERGKPLALVKAGRSERSRSAALSHTGAMTGSDTLHDVLFQRLGVARCETLDELVETLKLLHCHGPLASNRLAVAGASGGDMAMVADVARSMDIDFTPFADHTLDELKASTGPGVRLVNPLDFHTHTWFDAVKMQRMFAALLDGGYAVTAFMLDPPDETLADPGAYDTGIDALIAAASHADAPAALVSSLPESLSRYNRERCLAAGVAPTQGLAAFLRAFEHAARIGAAWRNWRAPVLRPGVDASHTGTFHVVGEHQGKELLKAHGIAVPRGVLCRIEDTASVAGDMGGTLVIKAAREGLAHKTEVDGVVLGVDSDSAADAAARMRDITDTVLVEEMITDGVAELIVGVGYDPQFGRYVTLGAGGVLAELLNDTATLLPPFDRDDVLNALSRLAIYRQLRGWRGRCAADIDAVADTLLRLWQLGEQLDGQLVDIEINPLIARPAGLGAVAVDILITLTGERNV